MNTPQEDGVQESILLAEYAIKTALIQVMVLDPQSIKILQSIPEWKTDTLRMMQSIETAVKSLSQAREVAKRLISKNINAKNRTGGKL